MYREEIIEKLKSYFADELESIKIVENESEKETMNVVALVTTDNPQIHGSRLVDNLNDIEIEEIDFLYPIIINNKYNYRVMEGEEIYGTEKYKRETI